MLGRRFLPRLGITVQLMTLRDQLANARRGVDRLRHAVAKAGSDAYAALCEELGVSGRSINEIPDMRMLRELVDRLEARSKGNAEAGTQAGAENGDGQARGATSTRLENGSHRGFAELRTVLLSLARQRSEGSRRPIDEVSAWASNGSFRYSDIGRMTEKDLPKLDAAVGRLKETASSSEF